MVGAQDMATCFALESRFESVLKDHTLFRIHILYNWGLASPDTMSHHRRQQVEVTVAR